MHPQIPEQSDKGLVGRQIIAANNQGHLRMFRADTRQQPLRRVDFTILFFLSILAADFLDVQRENPMGSGFDQRRRHHTMRVMDGPVFLLLFQTARAFHPGRMKILHAIERHGVPAALMCARGDRRFVLLSLAAAPDPFKELAPFPPEKIRIGRVENFPHL
ncbi:MAG: hypothetical protein ACKV2V_18230 [Blastocatellia bacterium]